MDGLTRAECRTASNAGERLDQFHQLRLELTQLHAEMDTLRRENLELRQQAGY